jgi:cobalt-zinc-cadmium efflux system membrane fusion protein
MSQSTTIHDNSTEAAATPPQAAPTHPPQTPGLWNWLKTAASTVLVMAVLAGIGVWGYSNDWTLPKFSALIGSEPPKVADWCEEHNVPESQCIECNKKLVPAITDYGWCEEHGVAQCPLHHPDVAQLDSAPRVTDEDMQRASRALATLPRAENKRHCTIYQRRIQFASDEAVEKAGIEIAVVEQRPIVEAVAANGEIVYDETRTAHLASRVAGNVWRVEKRVGDQVHKGDILALVDSVEIGRAKSDLLQAIAEVRLQQSTVDRLQPLAKDLIVEGKRLREAEAVLQEAQIKLLTAQQALVNLGLPVNADEFGKLSTQDIAKQIQFLSLPGSLTSGFDAGSTTSNLFPLRSPLDGVVVECKVVAGEIVDTSAMIFDVTDLRKLWMILDVRQDDARLLSQGQSVFFRPSDSKDGPEIKGSIAWISTAADDKTRTVKVRVDLPNPDSSLRANTFGTGRIVIREEPNAVVVPSEAVHSDGDCHLVFVRDKDYLREGAPKFFHVREVRLGAKNGDMTEIIAGLLPGEVIASKNSAVLEAQLLKGNLAGDDD